jgi:hypothetical protein
MSADNVPFAVLLVLILIPIFFLGSLGLKSGGGGRRLGCLSA